MKSKVEIIIFAVSLMLNQPTPAQDTLYHDSSFPSGIFLSYGRGLYAVKDEYISKEKYSGPMPYYSLEWLRFHNRNGYRLEFEYWKTTNISNNKISAEAQQFNFNQDFFYPIGNFPLFSRNVNAYLGPSLQLFYYEIYYHFVHPGTFISPTTHGIMGSMGVNAECIYHVSNKFVVEAFLRSNLISFAGKKIDERKYNNEPGPKLLSVFTATRLDADINVRYYLVDRVSFSLGYRFDLSRINKWETYIAASNNIIISLNFSI